MATRYASALALLLATVVASADGGHRAWVRAAVHLLPIHREDRELAGKDAELDAIGDQVTRSSSSAPRPPREWSALELTVAFHESGLSHRIIMGACKPHECDHGRARGLGQNHRNSLNGADWEAAPGDVEVQVRMLDQGLRRSYWQCKRSGVPWVQATLSAYAGQRCGAHWSGLDARLATFNRLVSR